MSAVIIEIRRKDWSPWFWRWSWRALRWEVHSLEYTFKAGKVMWGIEPGMDWLP